MLQNNNSSMATVVETFIIEETSNLIHDNESLAKWNEHIDALGLAGQREVVKTDKSPIPFLWMNSALIATFETLCPTKVDIAKYSQTPIPVEILDLVALSKREEYFDMIQIWFNETDRDPVCIGFKVDEEYKRKGKDVWRWAHYSKKYLIGRWADVKASLDTLVKMARERFIVDTANSLKQQIRDDQRRLEDLEQTANSRFGGALPSTLLPF